MQNFYGKNQEHLLISYCAYIHHKGLHLTIVFYCSCLLCLFIVFTVRHTTTSIYVCTQSSYILKTWTEYVNDRHFFMGKLQPADKCSCTGKGLLWPGGSCAGPRRAPGTWAWSARGSSAMFDAFCSWWHRRGRPEQAAFYQLPETLRGGDRNQITFRLIISANIRWFLCYECWYSHKDNFNN